MVVIIIFAACAAGWGGEAPARRRTWVTENDAAGTLASD